MKEEFKAFVRTKPELISYVSSGKMTWQKFYEIWSLYGNDDKIWNKYKVKEEVKNQGNNEGFSISSLIDSIKKVDMNQVQKGVSSMQKAIELLQGLSASKTTSQSNTSSYQPRQLFKKFED